MNIKYLPSQSSLLTILTAALSISIITTAANVQAARVIYVNQQPTSCQYYAAYNYIKCYYPNKTSKIFYSTKTYQRCNYHHICYWVKCFDYPFYHGCYKYIPNKVY